MVFLFWLYPAFLVCSILPLWAGLFIMSLVVRTYYVGTFPRVLFAVLWSFLATSASLYLASSSSPLPTTAVTSFLAHTTSSWLFHYLFVYLVIAFVVYCLLLALRVR